MPSTSALVTDAAAILAGEHRAAAIGKYGACTAPGFRVGPGTGGRARVHHQLPPIDLTDPDRASSEERWREQQREVSAYAGTLEAEGWTVDRVTVTMGPILLAVPPEGRAPERQGGAVTLLVSPGRAG
ncbi:hypothetical protein [Streptomyces europaeiscabiei]|uniref:hypothetical protein n=1 Tax=Streptomyces europaeiscabiei TaxID=146819 RepID=UPI0038F75338